MTSSQESRERKQLRLIGDHQLAEIVEGSSTLVITGEKARMRTMTCELLMLRRLAASRRLGWPFIVTSDTYVFTGDRATWTGLPTCKPVRITGAQEQAIRDIDAYSRQFGADLVLDLYDISRDRASELLRLIDYSPSGRSLFILGYSVPHMITVAEDVLITDWDTKRSALPPFIIGADHIVSEETAGSVFLQHNMEISHDEAWQMANRTDRLKPNHDIAVHSKRQQKAGSWTLRY